MDSEGYTSALSNMNCIGPHGSVLDYRLLYYTRIATNIISLPIQVYKVYNELNSISYEEYTCL